MPRINSRQKGARAEREVRDLFREQGYTQARRGQQFAGGADSPDVIIPELAWLHVESKMVEALNIYDAMRQSVRDSGVVDIPGKMPTVFHRRNKEDWHVTLRVEDFFKFLKHYHAALASPANLAKPLVINLEDNGGSAGRKRYGDGEDIRRCTCSEGTGTSGGCNSPESRTPLVDESGERNWSRDAVCP